MDTKHLAPSVLSTSQCRFNILTSNVHANAKHFHWSYSFRMNGEAVAKLDTQLWSTNNQPVNAVLKRRPVVGSSSSNLGNLQIGGFPRFDLHGQTGDGRLRENSEPSTGARPFTRRVSETSTITAYTVLEHSGAKLDECHFLRTLHEMRIAINPEFPFPQLSSSVSQCCRIRFIFSHTPIITRYASHLSRLQSGILTVYQAEAKVPPQSSPPPQSLVGIEEAARTLQHFQIDQPHDSPIQPPDRLIPEPP